MYKYFSNRFGHNLRYKIIGHGDNQLLIVSGGPGLTLEYLKPFHDMLDKEQFTVISYDYSGTASTKSPYLSSIADYASELNDFIDFLGLKGKLSIGGHSAGGAILMQYLLDYSGKVDNAILMNSFTSGHQIKEAVGHRISSFPSDFHEKYKNFKVSKDSALLDAAIAEYWFPRHLLKFGSINEDLAISLENYAKVEVGSYYIGNDLFDIDGAFLDWDIDDRLSEIKTRTLVMSGEYDYFTKEESLLLSTKVQNGQLWYSEQASHMPMYEDQDNFMKSISEFLLLSSE